MRVLQPSVGVVRFHSHALVEAAQDTLSTSSPSLTDTSAFNREGTGVKNGDTHTTFHFFLIKYQNYCDAAYFYLPKITVKLTIKNSAQEAWGDDSAVKSTAALTRDLDLVPRTHTGFTTLCNSSSRG